MRRHLVRFAISLSALAAIAWAQDTALVPGSPLERAIDPGQSHTYQLKVDAGTFVHVTAAQLGSDIAIRLNEPGARKYAEVDRLPYDGYEDIPWIAPAAGECTIEIVAKKRSKAGRYRIEVALRAPTLQDQSRTAAFVASWIDATALRDKHTAADSRAAAAKYEFATVEAHKAGDPRWEAYAFSEWAAVLVRFGEYAKARDLLERSYELRRTLDESYSLTVSLNGLGLVSQSLGELQRAVGYYEQSLEIRRKIHDRAGEAVALNNLGNVYKNLSNHEKAIDYLTQALALRRESGDRVGEATTLSALGWVHFVSGDMQAALDRYTESKSLRASLNDKQAEAGSAHMLGNVYFSLGNSAEAQQYWKQAEPVYRTSGETVALASLLYAMGMDDSRRKDPHAAIQHLEEALALHRKTQHGVATINDLGAVCRAYLAAGDLEKAEARGQEGVELGGKVGYPIGAGTSTECLGRVAFARGNDEAARTYFSKALELYRTTASREDRAMALGSLAKLEQRGGNLTTALRYIDQANALMEAGRALVNHPDLRAAYRAVRSNNVDLETSLLMDLHQKEPTAGYDERAFNLVEKWQARSLAEMIKDSRSELRQELTPEQRQREDELLADITGVQRVLFQEGIAPERKKDLNGKLSAAEQRLDLFQHELRRAGSRYAGAQYAETFDAARIRTAMLDADTALLAYTLGDDRSYAWALTTSGITSAVLPGRKQIEQNVASYRKLLSARVGALNVTSAMARMDLEGGSLYRMLVAPFETALAAKKRVVIVPDGALAYLPFEALRGAARLIERFSISYAPSASALAALRDREQHRAKPGRALLAFADPVFSTGTRPPARLEAYTERGFSFASLPNSRREVTGIRSFFAPGASHVHWGSDASEASMRAENLESFRFLQFAVHGYFDEEQPSRSGIVLSPGSDAVSDGILQSKEIMRLRLNADIATLSACQTGLGKVLAGEGVMGLTRAFLYAGAQSLVVSLWNVNDAATAELMKRFYGNLSAGMARDEALRQAKLSLMKTPDSSWRHPYFWAPFVFIGDSGPAAASRVAQR